jgi:H+/Cl- antiporter ClcA
MMLRHLRRNLGYIALGAVSGVLAGVASYVFLELLDRVTELRLDHGWIVWLLPVAGIAVGLTYQYLGGRARGGTSLAVSEAHAYTQGAPARMAPLVLAGTLVGHLFGASVGREGTAVQMSSSLTDAGARVLRLDHDHRAMLARAALAGGFGAVFGVPLAGVVFAMEVARRRTVRAFVATVPAAFVGNAVVDALGHHHAERAEVHLPFSFGTIVGLVAGGLIIGLAARLFAVGVVSTKGFTARWIAWPWLRPALGGAVTLALMVMVGRDYLGLSLPMLDQALAGHADWWDPLLKLAFTVVALGTGFVGGEVTPLFVVGATLGAVLGGPLPIAPAALASLGLAALFGAAANVPLACTVMAAELFGPAALLPALVVCLCARATAGGTSIYEHPLSDAPTPGSAVHAGP